MFGYYRTQFSGSRERKGHRIRPVFLEPSLRNTVLIIGLTGYWSLISKYLEALEKQSIKCSVIGSKGLIDL